jgi:hypothetical protein
MSEERDAILDAHRAAMLRHGYILLAFAALAIAWSINLTEYASFQLPEIPLALAVLCWAMSFYCGCRHIETHFTVLRLEAALMGGETREAVEKALRRATGRMIRQARLQFHYAVIGVVFYLAYHIWGMYMRTPWALTA